MVKWSESKVSSLYEIHHFLYFWQTGTIKEKAVNFFLSVRTRHSALKKADRGTILFTALTR